MICPPTSDTIIAFPCVMLCIWDSFSNSGCVDTGNCNVKSPSLLTSSSIWGHSWGLFLIHLSARSIRGCSYPIESRNALCRSASETGISVLALESNRVGPTFGSGNLPLKIWIIIEWANDILQEICEHCGCIVRLLDIVDRCEFSSLRTSILCTPAHDQ